MSNAFSQDFVAGPEHIDANGHVNNAVWVRWMEDLATAHWNATARPEDVASYAWVVTRHEIDYRGNVGEGETVTATTEILQGPRGARFDRHFSFVDAAGRELVRAVTTWAMVDKASGKLLRVPSEVAAPFMPAGGWMPA
ncbi:acyl-CoA thioesterase [Erythrobacter arachoides]|uniref:Acyl-CoA thioesterase n=1 Tax=Aurantiacibacter arachoides TaxID=1850444 RepID=A0A844ZUN7_9SPHN|nr:acyl-CoA thioesterase [Aurantiacibacter arachoides]MXO92031.1 acyl-CoA thioesterase [Aurantiacibacter arachoides]GGD60306.1 thioesterase [Aurantiacibacter arachoides]